MLASIIKKMKINEKNNFKYEDIKICLIYLAIGFLWIYFSDRIANELANSNSMLLKINTYKGFVYVIVTSTILYLLIRSLLKKVILAEKNSMKAMKNYPQLMRSFKPI